MNHYPDAVAQIAGDYVRRIKLQVAALPSADQQEFVREIESHIYEAYQQQAQPEPDPVAAILAVLRNLGEPAEVVSDRLPAAMVRSTRSKRSTI